MASCAFLIPGDIELPTGGYAYDRRLLALLGAQGVATHHVPLPASYPEPSDTDLRETAAIVASLPQSAVLLIDGLAFGAMPASLVQGFSRPVVALCHHPLGLEHGLSSEASGNLIQSERAALANATHVIVTGGETRNILVQDFSVPAARITVAVPGVDPAPRSTGTGEPPALLAVGSIVPRKGYGVLVKALAPLVDRNWRLTIAGADDRHPDEPASVRTLIARHGLEDRISLVGAVDDARLARLYDKADLFVLSSFYEGYGMVLSEAMARGLAIVTTRCGSAAAAIPDAAAIKVQPQSAHELTAALARALDDATLRQSMARASWLAGQQLPRWNDTVRIVAEVIRKAAA